MFDNQRCLDVLGFDVRFHAKGLSEKSAAPDTNAHGALPHFLHRSCWITQILASGTRAVLLTFSKQAFLRLPCHE